jgi:hypothetical protein
MILQGPHQEAVKFTMTGWVLLASITCSYHSSMVENLSTFSPVLTGSELDCFYVMNVEFTRDLKSRKLGRVTGMDCDGTKTLST